MQIFQCLKVFMIIIAILAIGIGCVEKKSAVDNSGIPILTEVRNIAGNNSDIAPVYEDKFVKTIVAWQITFKKNNLSGTGTVKTKNELEELSKNLQKAQGIVAILENQGCEQVSVAPFSGAASAKIKNATITGIDGHYSIYGPSVTAPWDAGVVSSDTEWYPYKSVGKFLIEVAAGWDYLYYRLRFDTDLSGVSKKNVADLNLQLKQMNITELTF